MSQSKLCTKLAAGARSMLLGLRSLLSLLLLGLFGEALGFE